MKASGHVRQNPFEAMSAFNDIASIVYVAKIDPLTPTAVEDDVPVFFAELLKRHFHIELVMLGDGVQHMKVIDVAAIPASDGSFRQGQIVVSDDQFRIKKLGNAQTITTGTCAGRVVEREHSGFQFGNGVAAAWAGKTR